MSGDRPKDKEKGALAAASHGEDREKDNKDGGSQDSHAESALGKQSELRKSNQGSRRGSVTTVDSEIEMELHHPGSKAVRKSKRKQTQSDTGWKCEQCGKVFTKDSDKLLECQYCELHFCIKCLGYKVNEYDVMAKPECMWFCPPCRLKVEKSIVVERSIEQRCDQYLQTFNERLQLVENELKQKCDEERVKQIVKNELKELTPQVDQTNTAGGITPPARNNEVMVEETVKEMSERRAREPNMLIFKAPEPRTNLKEDRMQEDLKFVEKLCNTVCGLDIDPDEDIVKTVRFGKKDEGGNPRPLLVVFADTDTKKNLFKNLSRLKEAEEPFKSISVQHDMTQKERQETKRLYAEARKKGTESGGDWTYKVRGPPWARKIVRLKPNKGGLQGRPEEEET